MSHQWLVLRPLWVVIASLLLRSSLLLQCSNRLANRWQNKRLLISRSFWVIFDLKLTRSFCVIFNSGDVWLALYLGLQVTTLVFLCLHFKLHVLHLVTQLVWVKTWNFIKCIPPRLFFLSACSQKYLLCCARIWPHVIASSIHVWLMLRQHV